MTDEILFINLCIHLHVYTFSTFQFRRATSPETDGQKSVFQGSGRNTNPGTNAAE